MWDAHCGELCAGIRWDRWPLEELLTVAACVGGRGLAVVCRLLAEDHSGWAGEVWGPGLGGWLGGWHEVIGLLAKSFSPPASQQFHTQPHPPTRLQEVCRTYSSGTQLA